MSQAYISTHVSAAPPSEWVKSSHARNSRHETTARAVLVGPGRAYAPADASTWHQAWVVKSVRVPSTLPTIARVVAHELEKGKVDFRTVDSLASDLGVQRHHVVQGLTALGDQVRRPWGAEDRFPDAYRLTKDGYTWREKLWRFRAFAGRTSR